MADHVEPSLKLSLSDLRENYALGGLDEAAADANPIAQFERWFVEARRAGLKEPNAMTLATATADGRPSARIVLLKEVDEAGFVFYTNYESRKARELRENPQAALTLFWAELERQVRVEGTVKRVSRGESERYFQSRPKGSRLGAWASPQSSVIADRKLLETRLKDLESRYSETQSVPLPEFWGGYRVEPEVIEFWQGRPNRLHDRLRYWRSEGHSWRRERLAP
jgi:pyridoxamine 5'-phosphate oxidase